MLDTLAISCIEYVDIELKTYIILLFYAALALFRSPSGCASLLKAVGEIPKGKDTSDPRTLIEVLIFDTSTQILGLIEIDYNAVSFLFNVISSSEPD